MNDQPSRAARTRYYMYPSPSVIAIEVCMRVVIGVPGVPVTPDLKVGSIAPAEMCDAIRMTSLAARTHYYPSLARGVFVRYAYIYDFITQSVTLVVGLSLTCCNHAMMSMIAIEVCIAILYAVSPP